MEITKSQKDGLRAIASIFDVTVVFTTKQFGTSKVKLAGFANIAERVITICTKNVESDDFVSLFFHELAHVIHYDSNQCHPYYDDLSFEYMSKKSYIRMAVKAERRTDQIAKGLFKTFYPYHRYIPSYDKRTNINQVLRDYFYED